MARRTRDRHRGLVGLSAVGIGLLGLAKLRMPVHYDIGNKAAYQV